MENKDIEIWNREAQKTLSATPLDWFSYYMNKSYRKVTEIGINHVCSDKINLLKTDLWNEGIDYQRDVLGLYNNYKNINLYGLDISPIVCHCAKSRIKNIHIAQGDIRTIPLKSNSFDILLDLSTLDHIPQNETTNVLREYNRVLKKSGIMVLVFWYRSLPVRLLLKEGPTQHYFSLNSIKNDVKKHFDIIEEYGIGIIPAFRLGCIVKRLPIPIRNGILNLALRLEHSKYSKIALKNFAGLYVIIGRCKK